MPTYITLPKAQRAVLSPIERAQNELSFDTSINMYVKLKKVNTTHEEPPMMLVGVHELHGRML